MKNALLSALSLFFVVSTPALANVNIGDPAPDFEITDIKGNKQSISQYKGKYIVLEWNNPLCPFVKKFYDVGAMQKLQKEAVAQDVVWLTINSSASGKQGHLSTEDATKHVESSNTSASAYIIDSTGSIGKLYQAKTTPHMFIINKDGTLAYAGAIDSKPSTKSGDIASATNYVSAALASLQAGQPIAKPKTTAYGCSVKY